MSLQPNRVSKVRSSVRARTTGESAAVRWILIAVCMLFIALFLVIPLAAVFVQAFEKGWSAFATAVREPDALAAIRLTLITAAIVVPLNTVLGVAAAWAIAKFQFVGKNLLLTLIDLPFSVSPVISGMIFVLLFGSQGLVGDWLIEHNLQVIFAVPGIVLATVFVTFPFVARELVPVIQAIGSEEEEAALVLGASGWQTFWKVTLPNIKWGLLYGVILCNARAMGEFGAVSVVSGHIRGQTNTMPLHVEILYNEYNFVGAFAVASLLAILGLVTLVAKSVVEWKAEQGAGVVSCDRENEMKIDVQRVTKKFGEYTALQDVTLEIPSGQLIALLGPSGSGKTTLLRLIAGLEEADCGEVRFDGEDVATRSVGSRNVGFVFQHYALFRHMTVKENIAFGLRVRPRRLRPSKQQIRDKVGELLKLVQLEGLARRFPSQLSGGQRQRVALARALAVEPQVLLLDEPFGALDAKVRKELRSWLRRLHDELHVTSVFVTHDQDEALELADQVVVMNRGKIEQSGTPEQVFHHPKTEFVINFLGEVNQFHGRVEDGSVHFGSIALPVPGTAEAPGTGDARVFVRPHEVTIDTKANGLPNIPAEVLRVHSAGPIVRVDLRTSAGQPLVAELSQERFVSMHLEPGCSVFVRPRHIRVFGDAS